MSDITNSEQGHTVNYAEMPNPNQEIIHSNIDQQNKIIAIMLREDILLISQSGVNITTQERENYLRQVSDGIIKKSDHDRLIGSINPPYKKNSTEIDAEQLFKTLSGDRQFLGIIAYFTHQDFKKRDNLKPADLSRFLSETFPNAVAFENAIPNFLKRIEIHNGQNKRQEYEEKVENFGQICFGKQWEYLKQIRLLEAEAMKAYPPITGQEQSAQFQKDHRLNRRVYDGYKDGGRYVTFDKYGKSIKPNREIIVVDRKMDPKLQDLIEQAKEIKSKYKTGLRAVFEISKLVYGRMHHPNALQIVQNQYGSIPGKEVLIGDISVDNNSAGICRHRSLLMQVLAAEIGVDISLVRGNYQDTNGSFEGHAWNEVVINGKRFLVDVTMPPVGNFGKLDYAKFMSQGGFPEAGIAPNTLKYKDVFNRNIY